jgi:hypothetical protein
MTGLPAQPALAAVVQRLADPVRELAAQVRADLLRAPLQLEFGLDLRV